MKNPSLSGSRNYILFIDDFSNYCWIYFLKNKSEAIRSFSEFKAQVENFASLSIKVLRTDNGAEYTSNEFEKLLSTAGIHHQLTVAYSPQQNGKAEKKNRTVAEMARCLLLQCNLPMKFWAEAVNTTNYIQNRNIIKELVFKTPFEIQYEQKPSVFHFKVFGCMCYA